MAKNLSTFAIAQMLNVDPGSVANWIDQNILKAYRTPGGHRRVMTDDLIVFLREHKMPIPPELATIPTRILIVDDEPAIASMLAKKIRAAHSDYEVIEANDGFRAGTVVATLKPDVVILDLRMPGMDGFEVCRLIKSQDSTKHAEIIAITAYPVAENVEKILECGARVCLSKPLDIDQILAEIKKSL